MKNLLLVLHLICVCMVQGDYTEHRKTCPDRVLWKSVGKKFCPDQSNYVRYHCLEIAGKKNYTEICFPFKQFVKGTYPVLDPIFRTHLDSRECPPDKYQPTNIFTNDANECFNEKSGCDEEGQVIFSNGSTIEDRSCRCDYNKGYTYLVPPANDCFCVPSQEDCSCYIKFCGVDQVLNQDYVCADQNETLSGNKTYKCQKIVVQNEAVLPTSDSPEDEGRLFFIAKIDNQNRIYADISIILTLIVFGLIYLIGYCSRKTYKKKGSLKFKTPVRSHKVVFGDNIELGTEIVGENAWFRAVFGNPVINNLFWEKDGKTLDSAGMQLNLVIRNVKPMDSGTYRCFVENKAGIMFSSQKIELETIGSPGFYLNVPNYVAKKGRKALDHYKAILKTEVIRRKTRQIFCIFIDVEHSLKTELVKTLVHQLPYQNGCVMYKFTYDGDQDTWSEYKRSKFESLIRSKFDGRDEELAKTETQVDFTIYNIPSDRRFSSVLETFFSPDALYIMVLDANEELYYTEPTTNHLYQVTKTGEKVRNYFNIIHSFKTTRHDSSFMTPQVILVGIHTQDTSQVKKNTRLQKEVLNCMYPQQKVIEKHIAHTIMIPRKRQSEDDWKQLNQAIFDSSKPTLGGEIPLRYLYLEDKLLERGEKIPVVTFQDALTLAKECAYPVTDRQEIENFLKYQHQIGNIVYYSNMSYIFINKYWMFETIQEIEKTFHNENLDKKIKDKALLPIECVNKISWRKTEDDLLFIKAFQELYILVEARIVDDTTPEMRKVVNFEIHVPWNVLSEVPVNFDLFTIDVENKTSWLGLNFDFLPSSLIYCMIIVLLEKYPICKCSSERGGEAVGYKSLVLSIDSNRRRKLLFVCAKNEIMLQVRFGHSLEEDDSFQSLREEIGDIIKMYSDRNNLKLTYRYRLKCPDSSYGKNNGMEIPSEILPKIHMFKFPCNKHGEHKDLKLIWFEEPKKSSDEKPDTQVVQKLDFTTEMDRKASVLGFPQITVEVTSYDVPVGESITFKCKIVSRLPVSSVMWWRKVDKKNLMIQTLYRNNDVIPQCPSFTIESVAVKDEGLYWCEAKNSIGSSKSPDINLVVNCDFRPIITEESKDPNKIIPFNSHEATWSTETRGIINTPVTKEVLRSSSVSSESSYKSVGGDDGLSEHGKPVVHPVAAQVSVEDDKMIEKVDKTKKEDEEDESSKGDDGLSEHGKPVVHPVAAQVSVEDDKMIEKVDKTKKEDEEDESSKGDDGLSEHGKPVVHPVAAQVSVEDDKMIEKVDKTKKEDEEDESSKDILDAILIYMDKDRGKAEDFRNHLADIVSDIKVELIEEIPLSKPGNTVIGATNELFSVGRYVFVLITEDFKLNMLQRYKVEKVLIESLGDQEKIFRVVPVTMADPKHIPEELVPLVDIKYYHYLAAKERGKEDTIYKRTIQRLVDYGRKSYLVQY